MVRETRMRGIASRYRRRPPHLLADPMSSQFSDLWLQDVLGNGVVVHPFPRIDLDALEPGDIVRDTAPRAVDGIAGRYSCVIPRAWQVMYTFGGTTMAAAIRAAVVELGRDDLSVVGADATFCAALPCGEMAMQVEILRNGRNGAQAMVWMWSDEDAATGDRAGGGAKGTDLVVAVVFGRRTDSPLHLMGTAAPEVPDPLECPGRDSFPDSPFNAIPYHRQTDFRVADARVGFVGQMEPGEPHASSWFRFNVSPMNASGCWEPAILAVPGDVLGPAVHAGLGNRAGFVFVVSLQIGLKFIADARTEWVLQHSRAQAAVDGFASGTAELYDENRELVAIATQTALLRPFESDPGATDA